jgi:NAD(P)-dependent dehydrogenase (short-subunit alcohol dehydrogenase family)
MRAGMRSCGKGDAVKKVLVTGSGTGFGHEVAMRLAEKGFEVIAAVEIWAQVQTLKRQAAERGSASRSRSWTSPMPETARRR